MKKLLVSILFITNSMLLFAQKDARVIYDKTPFDAKTASEAIGNGNISITGAASAKMINCIMNCKVYPPKGTIVYLFPYTKYFEDYLKYEKQKGSSKVAISKEAYNVRLEAKTGKNGSFTFTNLKPGEYFIETFVPVGGYVFQTEQTGSTDYYKGGSRVGSNPVYEQVGYATSSIKHKKKVVLIKEGEKTVRINL